MITITDKRANGTSQLDLKTFETGTVIALNGGRYLMKIAPVILHDHPSSYVYNFVNLRTGALMTVPSDVPYTVIKAELIITD